VPRCASAVWDRKQDSQAAFFAACDHPPEVAGEVDALREKKRGKRDKEENDLPEPGRHQNLILQVHII